MGGGIVVVGGRIVVPCLITSFAPFVALCLSLCVLLYLGAILGLLFCLLRLASPRQFYQKISQRPYCVLFSFGVVLILLLYFHHTQSSLYSPVSLLP